MRISDIPADSFPNAPVLQIRNITFRTKVEPKDAPAYLTTNALFADYRGDAMTPYYRFLSDRGDNPTAAEAAAISADLRDLGIAPADAPDVITAEALSLNDITCFGIDQAFLNGLHARISLTRAKELAADARVVRVTVLEGDRPRKVKDEVMAA